jgi:hypothetical protein
VAPPAETAHPPEYAYHLLGHYATVRVVEMSK